MAGWRWLGAQTWAARCPVFDGLSNFPLGLMSYSIVKSVLVSLCERLLNSVQTQIQGLALQHSTLLFVSVLSTNLQLGFHTHRHVWHVI